MYPNCMPDIKTLAQGVLQLFCSQHYQSRKQELKQPNIYRTLLKDYQAIYTLGLMHVPKIMILMTSEETSEIPTHSQAVQFGSTIIS